MARAFPPRPVTRGDFAPYKIYRPTWNNVLWAITIGHSLKNVGPSENSSPPVVSQAGYGPVSPSDLSKEGQRRCHFIYGVGAGKYLGYEGFCPDFPKLARKFFLCNFCLKVFSHKDHEDLFLV